MSIARMAAAWADTRYSGSDLLVLLAVADHANDAGEAWPSQETLAAKARLSVRQTQRVLDRLEADGVLVVRRWNEGRKRRNAYVLTTRQDVASSSGRPDISAPRHDIAVSHEPSLEPPEEPSAAAPQGRWSKAERDLVWDGLVAVCGAPTTKSEQADFGKTSSELRAVIPREATAAEVVSAMGARQVRWSQRYPTAEFTHRVLRQHWADLGRSRGNEIRGAVQPDEAELEDDGTGRRTF